MENSLLGKLPPELRNRVFKDVLKYSFPVRILAGDYKERFNLRSNLPRHILALTETCREIRKESAEYFYGINDFTILCPMIKYPPTGVKVWLGEVQLKPVEVFCETIGEANTKALRSVTVQASRSLGQVQGAFPFLIAAFKALRKFAIHEISVLRFTTWVVPSTPSPPGLFIVAVDVRASGVFASLSESVCRTSWRQYPEALDVPLRFEDEAGGVERSRDECRKVDEEWQTYVARHGKVMEQNNANDGVEVKAD